MRVRWELADRSHPGACRIFDGHYSRRASAIGSGNCAPPGRLVVLVAMGGGSRWGALWVSRQQEPEACRHAWPGSWECSAFRNVEGVGLSSELVTEAVAATRAIWGDPPAQGFITFVDEKRVRSTNPGCCFKKAGWTRLAARTKDRNLVVLHLPPERFPKAVEPIGAQGAMFA